MLVSALAAVAVAAPSILEPVRTNASSPADAAVVVGIEDYPFLPDVSYASRDAEAAYQLMVYTLGVPADRVARLDGGSREQILAAVRQAAARVGDGGTLWIWFAGHGAAGSTGDLLLVGDDARPDPGVFEARGVAVSELAGLHDGPIHVFLDACWAGRGRDGEELLPGARFVVPSYAQVEGQLRLWTAASESQLSGPYEPARHGLFTYFAVGALRGWADGELDGRPDGVVTAAEATAYVARMLPAVQARSQTPRWQGDLDVPLVRARGLERAPAIEALAPAGPVMARIALPAGGDQPLVPPIRYLGHGVYEDGARRNLSYADLQRETRDLAPVQGAFASRVTWDRMAGTGWAMVGAGALTSLVGLAIDGGRRSSYDWDYDRYRESVQRCEGDDFFCPPDPVPVEPVTGRVPMIGAGIMTAGATFAVTSAIGRRAQRRRVARVASEELRR